MCPSRRPRPGRIARAGARLATSILPAARRLRYGQWMRIAFWTLLCALCALTAPAGAFTEFESGQVRPLALSPDGTRLFAVNTPDDRLEIFDVTPGGLTHAGSVTVGLEPVAVAARSTTEVWVVN